MTRRSPRAFSSEYDALEHVVRVVAADELLGLGLERVRTQAPLDQPLHRAAGECLDRTRGQRELVECRRTSSSLASPSGTAGDTRGPAAAAARSHSWRVGASPRSHTTSERPRAACGRSGSSSTWATSSRKNDGCCGPPSSSLVRDESTEQALGARSTDVEQVALAVELVLAHGQREPGRTRDLEPVVIGEERVAASGARELALLEPEQVEHLEPARAHLERARDLDAVGLGRVAEPHGHVVQRVVERAAGGSGAAEGAHLCERLARGREGPRYVRLVAAEDVRAAQERPREEPLHPPLELREQLQRVAARVAHGVDLRERQLLVLVLPELARRARRRGRRPGAPWPRAGPPCPARPGGRASAGR